MQRMITRLMIAGFFALALWQNIGAALADYDPYAPSIDYAYVFPVSITLGHTVTIGVRISEAGSFGANGVTIVALTGRYQLANGTQALVPGPFTLVSGDPGAEIWEAQVTVPNTAPAGTYVLQSVTATDTVGRTTTSQPRPDLYFDPTFTVTSVNTDTTPPWVRQITISASRVTPNTDIALTVSLGDDYTGIASITGHYQLANGSQILLPGPFLFGYGRAWSAYWNTTITVPDPIPSGTYLLTLTIIDGAGNTLTASVPDATFVVDNAIRPMPNIRPSHVIGIEYFPVPNPPSRGQVGPADSPIATLPTHR